MKEYFISELKSTKRKGIKALIEYLENSDFFTAPASTAYHGAYPGGLLEHSINVLNCLRFEYANLQDSDYILPEIPEESIIISALLHDVCKICFYRKTIKWKKNEHNDWMQYDGYEIEDSFPIGHGEKSVIMLLKLGLDINPCEMLAIRYHMGFWGESNTEFKIAMKSAIKMCPLVVLLQQADCAATMMFEKEIEI